jgi:hypothetical protein
MISRKIRSLVLNNGEYERYAKTLKSNEALVVWGETEI